MSEMKDSGIQWIGLIPSHWAIVKMKYLGDLYSGGVDKKIIEGEELFQSIHYMDVYNNSMKKIGRNDSYLIVSASKTKAENCSLKRGDVLFTNSSETPEDIGHSVVISEDLPNILFGYHLMRFRPGIKLHMDYLRFLFGSHFLRSWFEYRSVGITRYGVDGDSFADALIFVPPLEEQYQKSTFLNLKCSAIDSSIERIQKQIELLKEYEKSVITESVTKGLDTNVPMKDSGIEWIGLIPSHWEISRFSYEAWVRARLGWKGLKAEEYVDDGAILLSTPNIKGMYIDFENVNFIGNARFEESPEIKLRAGDVLLSKDGSTLGTVNVVRSLPKETTVNGSIAVITPNQRIEGIFLMYFIKSHSMASFIDSLKDGSGVPHLFQSDIRKMNLLVPPTEEQKKIASYLDSFCENINKIIIKKQCYIKTLNLYKKSLIFDYVTGKKQIEAHS